MGAAHPHAIPAHEWGAAVASLLEPVHLTPLDALRSLACATLFLVGSEDPIVPVGAVREVSALVRDSEVAVIEEAGHSAYFEKAAQFNQCVLDFISRRAQFQPSPATRSGLG